MEKLINKILFAIKVANDNIIVLNEKMDRLMSEWERILRDEKEDLHES